LGRFYEIVAKIPQIVATFFVFLGHSCFILGHFKFMLVQIGSILPHSSCILGHFYFMLPQTWQGWAILAKIVAKIIQILGDFRFRLGPCLPMYDCIKTIPLCLLFIRYKRDPVLHILHIF